MAHGYAGQTDQRQAEPARTRPVGHGVMSGRHDEQDRQSHIIIVHASQLGGFAKFRINRAARNQICHHDFLVGDNIEKHIARHDGANHGPDLHIGGPVGEYFACDNGSHNHEKKQQGRK